MLVPGCSSHIFAFLTYFTWRRSVALPGRLSAYRLRDGLAPTALARKMTAMFCDVGGLRLAASYAVRSIDDLLAERLSRPINTSHSNPILANPPKATASTAFRLWSV